MDRVTSVETSTDTPHVVICTTGGTITASTVPGGVVVAGDSDVATRAMLDGLRAVLPASIRVSARAVLDADSSTFGPAEWDRLVDAVTGALADPGVTGVVVQPSLGPPRLGRPLSYFARCLRRSNIPPPMSSSR